ncbi:36197_t:CDS:2, partial [Gigaspora margarita]
YTPQQVDKNHVFEIENEVESFNTGFVEDTVDVPLILLKELIPTTAIIILLRFGKLFIIDRKEYVMANGLFKKAIQIGLDAGPSAIQELNNIMKNYIVRYTPKHNQEVTQRNPIRTLLDNSHNVENYSDIADDTDSNSIDNDDGSYSEENDENIDPSLIQNHIIRAKKGAPRKSRFKGSQETNLKNKERPKAAGRKPTEYQQCYKFGHNKAGYEKWHKKNQVPYSFK